MIYYIHVILPLKEPPLIFVYCHGQERSGYSIYTYMCYTSVVSWRLPKVGQLVLRNALYHNVPPPQPNPSLRYNDSKPKQTAACCCCRLDLIQVDSMFSYFRILICNPISRFAVWRRQTADRSPQPFVGPVGLSFFRVRNLGRLLVKS